MCTIFVVLGVENGGTTSADRRGGPWNMGRSYFPFSLEDEVWEGQGFSTPENIVLLFVFRNAYFGAFSGLSSEHNIYEKF